MSLIARSLTLLSLSLITLSCSKGPEQYKTGAPGEITHENTNSKYTIQDPGRMIENPQDLLDTEVKQRPIIYGVGAGGITFDTTYEKSMALIGEPKSGNPNSGNGRTIYDSGMQVYWLPGSKTPYGFVLNKNYEGPLTIGSGFEPSAVILGDSFKDHFKNEGPAELGNNLARKLYRALEKAGDDVDCLNPNVAKCAVNREDPETIEIALPQMIFAFDNSTEQKELYVVIMFRELPLGSLDNSFDLSRGKFAFEGANLSLGSTWGNLHDNLGVDPAILDQSLKFEKGADSFAAFFGSVTVGIDRSKYEASYKSPEKTEKIKSMSFSSSFSHPFMLGGEYLLPKLVDGKWEFGLTKTKPETGGLTLKFSLPKRTRLSFTESLNDLISKSLVNELALASAVKDTLGENPPSSSNPSDGVPGNEAPPALPEPDASSIISISTLTGELKDSKKRKLTASSFAYDLKNEHGIGVDFSVDEETGNLGDFNVGIADDPYTPHVIKNYVGEQSPVFESDVVDPRDGTKTKVVSGRIGEIEIGSIVELRDIDEGQYHTTVVMNLGGKEVATRSSYNPSALVQMRLLNQAPTTPHFTAVSVSDLGLSLYLKGKKVTDPKTKEVKTVHRVAAIAVGSGNYSITGLCGDQKLSFEMGEKDDSVREKIRSLNKARDKESACIVEEQLSGMSSGTLDEVYFPREQLKLRFADRELVGYTIYSRPDQVK